jgi:hypothetical protein
VPMFVVMQIIGFGIATGILTYLVTSEN